MDYSQIQLRDMQIPEAIGWWQLAPGWWMLLGLLGVLFIAFFLLILKKFRQPKSVALQKLRHIQRRFGEHQDKQLLLVECNILMKRLALTLYPRHQVAALSGQRWLDFLRDSSEKLDISQLEVLAQGPYQTSAELSSDELIQSCRQWIKQVRGVADV